MKINKAWHRDHPMPINPTTEERITWHVAHQQNCACRAAPKSLAAAVAERLGGIRQARPDHRL